MERASVMIPKATRRLGWAAAMACCCVWLGCGPGGPTQPTATLEGAVTVDGDPVEKGEVQFIPEGAGQARPVSAEITAGRYRAEQVPQGKVTVRFNATRETGKMIAIPASDETYPEVVDVIPAKYAQGISIEVTGDNPHQDFELTSEP